MNKYYKKILISFLFSFLIVGIYGLVGVEKVSAEAEITNAQAADIIEVLINAGIIAPDKVSKARELALLLRGQSSNPNIFNNDLTVGSSGQDILVLQRLLNKDATTRVANSGNGSPGKETTYFGDATKIAVAKFQQKYGISPANGFVGTLTRQKLNEITAQSGINTQNAGLTLDTAGTIPFVDIKVGTLDASYVNVASGAPFTLVWTSRNVTSCIAGSNPKPVIGTQSISGISQQTTYGITCTGPQGTATDWVTVYTGNSYDDINGNNSNDDYSNDDAYIPNAEDLATLERFIVPDETCVSPCVDLKIDGQDTGVSVTSAKNSYKYSLSWASKGVQNCKIFATSTDSQFDMKDFYATNTSSIDYVVNYYSSLYSPKEPEIYQMSFPGFVYGEPTAVTGGKAIKLPTPKNLTFSIKCENATNPSQKISDSVKINFAQNLLPKVDLKLDGMDRLTTAYNQKYVQTPENSSNPYRLYNVSWTTSGVTGCIADNLQQYYNNPEVKPMPDWSSTPKGTTGNSSIVLNADPDISKITLRLTCDDGYVSDKNSKVSGVYKGLIDYVPSPYNAKIHSHVCPMDGLYSEGEDLIDPTKITWPADASDLGSWPITGFLQNVTTSGSTVSYPHNKASVWPAVPVPGVGQTAAGVYGNAWVIVPMGAMNQDGTYNSYTAQYTGWMNPGQTTKSTDELQGPGKVSTLEDCPGGAGSTCNNNGVVMTVPNYYGFMVSTLAKGGYRSPSNERTNIVVSGCTNLDYESLFNGSATGGTGSFGSTGLGQDSGGFNTTGATGGALQGAVIGTMILPGIGTGIGGVVGGVIGGFSGW
jgi:hypothetical protein